MNKDINDKLSVADRHSDKLIQSTEKELIKQYSLSLKNIRGQLASIYQKFGDDVSYSDMQKYNRLASLEQTVMGELRNLYKFNAKTLNQSLHEQFSESYYRTGFALETGAQISLTYTMLNPEVIKAAVNNPVSGLTLSQRLEKNRNDIIYRIRGDITQGLILGEGYSKMSKRVKDTLEGDASKAVRIVQTEAHRVQLQGRLESIKHAQGKGINMLKVWDASLDSKTRSGHRRLDGVKVGLDEDFVSSSGGKGKIPGSMGNAADDVSCRCSMRTEILGFEPSVRRARDEDGKSTLIPYQTYEQWAEHRIAPKNTSGKSSNNNADNVIIKQLGFSQGSLRGLDAKTINSIKSAITKIHTKYPFIKGFASVINAKRTDDFVAQAVMGYDQSGLVAVGLNLSSSFLNDADLDYLIKEAVNAQFWPKGSNRESIIIHEYGHFMEYYAAVKRYGVDMGEKADPDKVQLVMMALQSGSFSKTIKQEALANLGLSNDSETIKNNLSDYANKNSKEFLAESFAEYEGSENPRPLATETIRILNEKLKELE